MKALIISAMLFACSIATAAPAPYPVTVNSQSATIPNLVAYQASETAFAISLVDGSAKMDLTGHSVWMSWATNATSTSVSTAKVDIVSATNGTATAVFSPSSVNYTPGRYMYEIGVSTGGTVRTVRHGVFLIYGSPYATGADPVTWTTNWNLGAITLTGIVPIANLPVTTNGASTSDVLIPTAGALSRAIAAAGVAYDDSWTNSLGSLAWVSSITSNDVDAVTDAAYRAGGETLWPASSNAVLSHVVSHGINEYGGFRAATFLDSVGEALFKNGIAIGTNLLCRYDSIRLGNASATRHATDSNSITIGNESMSGIGGTTIGHYSQSQHDAVTIGYNAGNEVTGSNSVSIGVCSDAEIGAVAIGSKADAIGIGSVQIGQGINTTDNTVQFRTFPLLDASGIIPVARMSGITSNQIATATDDAYRNTKATGITSNQMDTATDAAYRSATGVVPVYWSMGMSANQDNLVRTNYNVIAFNVNQFSAGATVNTNTYTVTFGTTGIYALYLRIRHSQMDSVSGIRGKFVLTGNDEIASEYGDIYVSSGDSSSTMMQSSVLAKITNAAATVQATFYHGDAENDVDLIANWSVFTGHKIADL